MLVKLQVIFGDSDDILIKVNFLEELKIPQRYFQINWPLLKVAFFTKVGCIFLKAQKMCPKLFFLWKRDLEIAFGLESVENSKYKA